ADPFPQPVHGEYPEQRQLSLYRRHHLHVRHGAVALPHCGSSASKWKDALGSRFWPLREGGKEPSLIVIDHPNCTCGPTKPVDRLLFCSCRGFFCALKPYQFQQSSYICLVSRAS